MSPHYRATEMVHLPASYLTLAEAAAVLGLSASTLRQQARRGTLRAVLVGKTYVVDRAELDRYRDEHQRPAAITESEERLLDGNR